MAHPLIDELKRERKEMKSDRTNFEGNWQDVTSLVLPNKDNVTDFSSKVAGEKKGLKILDSSAVHYNNLLASALMSLLINPISEWWGLRTGRREIDSDSDVIKWLQELVTKGHKIIQNTNFYNEMFEYFRDITSLGTGEVYMEDDDETLMRFHSFPCYESWIKENFRGEVDTIMRDIKMTLRQIAQKWGINTILGDKDLKKLWDEGKKDEKRDIVHFVLPRKDVKRLGSQGFKFASIYYMEKPEVLLHEGGFRDFPYLVGRWSKITGESYGRSPAMDAMADIKMLQQVAKLTIRAAQKSIDPPLLVADDGIIGRLRGAPGAISSYRAGTSDPVLPLETGAKPILGIEYGEVIRKNIKRMFFVDQLQLDLGDRATTVEVDARIDEQLRLMGPFMARQNSETLAPFIGRLLRRMDAAGEFPPNRPAVLDGIDLQALFTSQIAKAQLLGEARNLDNYLLSLEPLVKVDPTAYDFVDPEKILKIKAELQGINFEIFREKKAVEDIREKRFAQQKELATLEREAQQASTAKDATQAGKNIA